MAQKWIEDIAAMIASNAGLVQSRLIRVRSVSSIGGGIETKGTAD